MTNGKRAPVFLGAAAALAAGLMAYSASAQESVKIGMFTPLTGASSIVGIDMFRGVELAINAVNAGLMVPMTDGTTMELGPGLLGAPVTLIVEDVESRPQAAMDAVRKLVTVDNVAVVLGEYSSGRTLPAGQYTNENGVPHISIGANSPLLRDVGGDYFFNAIGLAGLQGYRLIDMARAEMGATTVATLFPNNPWGVGVEIATCEAAAAAGMRCVSTVRYEEQKTDYRAELRQTEAAGADVVVFFAYGADAILILRQAYEMGIDTAGKWLAPEMSNWAADVAPTPEIGEGIRGVEHAVTGELYDAYVAAYVAAYGEQPLTVFGAFGYDAAMIAALAIAHAGTTDHDAIRDAIPVVAETYLGITGNLAFDEDGMRLVQDYGTFIYQGGQMVPYTPPL